MENEINVLNNYKQSKTTWPYFFVILGVLTVAFFFLTHLIPERTSSLVIADPDYTTSTPIASGLGDRDPREIAAKVITIFLEFIAYIGIILMSKGLYNIFYKKQKGGGLISFGVTIIIITMALFGISGFTMEKPVIYLYPEEEGDIYVKLDYKGSIFESIPLYEEELKGWKVTATPEGKITHNGIDYPYLFWEGIPSKNPNFDLSKGFVIRGEDTERFLESTLKEKGLIENEYTEFIEYWEPRMKNNKYNLIHFAEEKYTDIAKLNITPTPDSVLRVFMVFKPLRKEIAIENQSIVPFIREGFTVIEWGGLEL